MKKRVLAWTMAAVMAATMTACGGNSTETTAAAQQAAAKDNSEGERSQNDQSEEAKDGYKVTVIIKATDSSY